MIRRFSVRSAATLLGTAALLFTAPAARAQTFDFEAQTGQVTPFSVTSGGVTAAFGNPGAPFHEVLTFGPGTFDQLSGNVLGTQTGTTTIVGAQPLGIDFSAPLTSITLDFALNGIVPGTQLTLDAFLGGVSVGSVTAPAALPGPIFTFPEGVATFNSAIFDRVVLSADAGDFLIDNVTVSPAVVPEPATLWLSALGLGVLAAAGRLRGRARTA